MQGSLRKATGNRLLVVVVSALILFDVIAWALVPEVVEISGLKTTSYYDMHNPCGAVSVTVACSLVGWNVTLAEVKQVVHSNSFGQTSMQDVIQGLNAIGVAAAGVRLDSSLIGKVDVPLILHWRGNHFLTAVSVKHCSVLLIDPPNQTALVSLEDLEDSWSGEAVIVADSASSLKHCLDRIGVNVQD